MRFATVESKIYGNTRYLFDRYILPLFYEMFVVNKMFSDASVHID